MEQNKIDIRKLTEDELNNHFADIGEEKYTPEPKSGCWLWTATKVGHMGYGNFWFDGRKQLAHRVAWTIYRGQIPTYPQLV